MVLQDEPARKEQTDPQQKGVHRHLVLTETEVCDVSNVIEGTKPGPELDCCILKQHHEHINHLKRELTDVCHNIVTIDEVNFDLKHVVKVWLITYFCMPLVLYFAGYIYSSMLSYRYAWYVRSSDTSDVSWSSLVPDVQISFRGLPIAWWIALCHLYKDRMAESFH